MGRPPLNRRVEGEPRVRFFKPQGVPMAELAESILTKDGLEAVRLADVEGLYHDEAARRMGVSRATFGRVLEQARRAVGEAITQGRALRIEGGNVEVVRGMPGAGFGRFRGRRRCGRE
ncbi:MAG TPA: DUF134 domain-containing protein [bacterium]|nr:DUF134 domain-containing protein [bacterium]